MDLRFFGLPPLSPAPEAAVELTDPLAWSPVPPAVLVPVAEDAVEILESVFAGSAATGSGAGMGCCAVVSPAFSVATAPFSSETGTAGALALSAPLWVVRGSYGKLSRDGRTTSVPAIPFELRDDAVEVLCVMGDFFEFEWRRLTGAVWAC